MPSESRRERVTALREVARSGVGVKDVVRDIEVLRIFGNQNEVKNPTLSRKAREGWGTLGLLGWGFGERRSWGFGGYFWGRNRIDLHCGQDFLQAVEDSVAVHVLVDAVLGANRGYVEGEFIAGSVLEGMEVLRIALARAFPGDSFGAMELEIAELPLGVRPIRQLRCAQFLRAGSIRQLRCAQLLRAGSIRQLRSAQLPRAGPGFGLD